MSQDSQYLNTLQAAQALGVSISTVKRWVDSGVLPAHKTAGGHRKLLQAEVLALARQSNLPRGDLSRLTMPAGKDKAADLEQLRSNFLAAILEGDANAARSMVQRAYQEGVSIEKMADQIIGPVMAEVGHQWEKQKIDVWQEHRATQTCAQALFALKTTLENRAERNCPVALGAAPEGDPYLLPSLLAQMVLLDAGWQAINLGPNTPFASLLNATRETKPRLIWLSVSFLADPELFLREYRKFYGAFEPTGVAVAVGGQGLIGSIRSAILYTTYGDGLSHLAELARTLHTRPRRPRAGRPSKK
jgi:MerR family transcriptional regulator, light-induced transcriptional regulator